MLGKSCKKLFPDLLKDLVVLVSKTAYRKHPIKNPVKNI